jgi:hypothetical protein
MSIEIINYKEINKGALKATCDVKMVKWGNFIIRGLAIFEKDGSRWVSFPSKEYEKDGKKKWFPHCYFETDNMAEIFRKQFFLVFDKHVNEQIPLNPVQTQVEEKIKPKEKSSSQIAIDDLGLPPF